MYRQFDEKYFVGIEGTVDYVCDILLQHVHNLYIDTNAGRLCYSLNRGH
jgi:hypothetical protein